MVLFIREGGVAPREAVGALLRRALGGDVVVSDSKVNASQWQRALSLRPQAVVLSSSRAAAEPAITWRPLRDRPLSIVYAGLWRTDSRNPVLQALVTTLGAT